MSLPGYKGTVLIVLLMVVLLAVDGQAVLFRDTGDPSYNTNAPAGSLTNSGWQYEGQWDKWNGTPIAPTFFLAAHHVFGTNGQEFVLNGFTYHTVASFDCPNCDLRVWQVAETFPSYAPLYTATDEVGKHCVVIGRGTERGSQVATNGQLKGWEQGITDGVQRWGENDVASIYNDPDWGPMLACNFDRAAGTNECTITVGDSSGALFIQDGSTWKLAGVHHGSDLGPFSFDGTAGTEFFGALMDVGGLWYWNGAAFTYLPDASMDYVTGFISTRVSANASWINSVINFLPGPDLRIADIQVLGPDVQISLATGSNRLYRVEHTSDLVTGAWTAVTNNVAGTGGTITVTDPGATGQVQQFYRAVLIQ